MKNIFIALALLISPALAFAQHNSCPAIPVGFALTAGYSNAQIPCAVGEAFVAVKLKEHLIIYPFSFKVHNRLADPTVPVIIEPRIGYKIKAFELYGGVGYHSARQSDSKVDYSKNIGFKPGCGIVFHTRKMVLTTAMAGNIWTLQAGIFRFKNPAKSINRYQ